MKAYLPIGMAVLTSFALLLDGGISFAQEAGKGKEEETKGKATDTTKKDEEKAKPAVGFGVDRGKAKGEKSEKGDDDKKEKPSKEEIAKRKEMKKIEKKLGRKEEGFFLFQLFERKFESPPEDPQNPNARRREQWVAKDTSRYLVIEGREAAADNIYRYMSEFAPDPKEKKSKSRKGKDEEENQEKPDPLRDWKFIQWFETSAQAAQVETNLKERDSLRKP